MKKIIHKIRQKSYREKEKIAFFSALFITILIGVLWFSGTSTLNNTEAKDQMANVNSPFEEIKSRLGSIIKDYKTQQLK
jgi:hypothetical protein